MWVVVDGSTDGTAESLAAMATARIPSCASSCARGNGGKGAAIFDG